MRKGFACPHCAAYCRGLIYAREPVYGLMLARCPGCGAAGVLEDLPRGSISAVVARSPQAARRTLQSLLIVLVVMPLLSLVVGEMARFWREAHLFWNITALDLLLNPIRSFVLPTFYAATEDVEGAASFFAMATLAITQGIGWGVQMPHVRAALATQMAVPTAAVLYLAYLALIGGGSLTSDWEKILLDAGFMMIISSIGGVLAIGPTVAIRRRRRHQRRRVRARLRKKLRAQGESA
ncbi:MAG: hypothetical protein C0475_08100 [Planctomyces sp.]|nr:hypothetical protein [Planctomyces sp.]MBA4039507.1 hypothetical protein [Planctomyces sp.]MBA4120658.1 hypothetical protein [Isosphaera sp.]